MSEWTLTYYETASGRRPVREYADALDGEEAARFDYDIERLERFGVRLGMPHVRKLRGDLWELRITGPTQHRVLYFVATRRRLVLLHAFTKKTQKTPTKELDTAIRRMDDFQRRDAHDAAS